MFKPKGTPAGPGGKFDPDDRPGKDDDQDGIYGKPKKKHKPGQAALDGLKSSKVCHS